MTHAQQTLARAPALIRYSGPVTRRLLGFGVPMGPNTLLTVRGRISGRSIAVPLAVLELNGRRWVVGTFGDTNWCHNLRAHREAELRIGGTSQPVRARELGRVEATTFFREVVPAYLLSMPLHWRALTRVLVRLGAPDVFSDPVLAARRRPVFELETLPGNQFADS
jgi:deazaflavin-dependent oxidoreductase (nitroreductase family)